MSSAAVPTPQGCLRRCCFELADQGWSDLEDCQFEVITLDKRIVDELLCFHAPGVVNVEQTGNNLLGQLALIEDLVARVEHSFLDLKEQVIFGCSSKRIEAGEHDEEEHAQGPHVHRFSFVVAASHDLWTHVAGSAAKNVQTTLVGTDHHTEAEVDQFDHVGLVFDEHIVELDVAMHDVLFMQVQHCLGQLLEDSTCLVH